MNDMPPVIRCDATTCFFNRNNNCHAPAINVGGPHPECDTFTTESRHIGRREGSMVGACHVRDCRWNKDLLCSAQGIHVSPHSNHADCTTFEKV
ncbi:MAG TPA: DUF1540 domain-containing protein [Myxococcales bacterium]|jgi:hypothetical protein|nr:DUF1540 domain-containing protein [Myxococcales bacterium]